MLFNFLIDFTDHNNVSCPFRNIGKAQKINKNVHVRLTNGQGADNEGAPNPPLGQGTVRVNARMTSALKEFPSRQGRPCRANSHGNYMKSHSGELQVSGAQTWPGRGWEGFVTKWL